MNIVELNMILYYADFLSMKSTSTPVTDTCKYFFIHGTPMNACYIANVEPTFDENNKYFKQSKEEYFAISTNFGDSGIKSFINDICHIKACGCVSGDRMLAYIHLFNPRFQYYEALNKYNNWKKQLIFKHLSKDEDGNTVVAKCSKQYAHVEKALGIPIESSMDKSSKIINEKLEKTIKHS